MSEGKGKRSVGPASRQTSANNSSSNSPVRMEELSITDMADRVKRSQTEKALRQLRAKEDSSSNFMIDFDPSKPRREKQKATKRYSAGSTKPSKNNNLFNDKGIHLKSGKDMCDCLQEECPGCHFPCIKCKSTKCGHDCRQNRKFQYEFVEFENKPKDRRVNPYPLNAARA